jgi:hypothetical protein
MATLAEQIWAEILDIRRPLETEERPRKVRDRQLRVRGGTSHRARTGTGRVRRTN